MKKAKTKCRKYDCNPNPNLWHKKNKNKIRGYKTIHTFTIRIEDKTNDNNNINNNKSNNNNDNNSNNNNNKTKSKQLLRIVLMNLNRFLHI